jgi:hypothetical protein
LLVGQCADPWLSCSRKRRDASPDQRFTTTHTEDESTEGKRKKKRRGAHTDVRKESAQASRKHQKTVHERTRAGWLTQLTQGVQRQTRLAIPLLRHPDKRVCKEGEKQDGQPDQPALSPRSTAAPRNRDRIAAPAPQTTAHTRATTKRRKKWEKRKKKKEKRKKKKEKKKKEKKSLRRKGTTCTNRGPQLREPLRATRGRIEHNRRNEKLSTDRRCSGWSARSALREAAGHTQLLLLLLLPPHRGTRIQAGRQQTTSEPPG